MLYDTIVWSVYGWCTNKVVYDAISFVFNLNANFFNFVDHPIIIIIICLFAVTSGYKIIHINTNNIRKIIT